MHISMLVVVWLFGHVLSFYSQLPVSLQRKFNAIQNNFRFKMEILCPKKNEEEEDDDDDESGREWKIDSCMRWKIQIVNIWIFQLSRRSETNENGNEILLSLPLSRSSSWRTSRSWIEKKISHKCVWVWSSSSLKTWLSQLSSSLKSWTLLRYARRIQIQSLTLFLLEWQRRKKWRQEKITLHEYSGRLVRLDLHEKNSDKEKISHFPSTLLFSFRVLLACPNRHQCHLHTHPLDVAFVYFYCEWRIITLHFDSISNTNSAKLFGVVVASPQPLSSRRNGNAYENAL